MDFAARLKEAMTDAGHSTGHGAGSRLARRFKISVPSATAWLKGLNLPEPPRARELAELYGVRFEWLYFGQGHKRGIADDHATYGGDLKLSTEEEALLHRYRAADDPLRAIVDAALGVKHEPTPERGKKR
jgi:transcriptional regulator with XRE-family HTH domain